MDSIKKGISLADMFSEPYRLNLNGKTSRKTVFGGILTLLCAVVSVAIFFVLGNEMFLRAKPRLNSSQKVIDDGTVRLRDLGLFWGYYGLYGQIIHFDEPFQKAIRMKAIWLNFAEIGAASNLVHKRLFIEQCKLSHFSDEIAGIYASQKKVIEAHYCINPTKYELNGEIFEEEIIIKKPYTENLSKSIWLSTSYCDKAETGCDTSFTDTEDFYVMTRMTDYFIDGDDFSDPIKATVKSRNLLVGKGISLVDYTTLGINRANLDDGVVFESNREVEYHSFKDSRMQIQMAKGEMKDMYDLVLDIDSKIHTTNRSYLKLQELAAQVAAFTKVLVVLCGFIGKIHSKSEIFREVSCELNSEKRPLNINYSNEVDKKNSTVNCLRTKPEKKVNHSFFRFVKNTFASNSLYFAEFNKALSVRNVIQREAEKAHQREETIVFDVRQRNNEYFNIYLNKQGKTKGMLFN